MFHRDIACRTLRAVGLPKNQTHQILNCIQKWISSSGEEWTVKRLKEIHQWWIKRQSGDITFKPAWHAHGGKDPIPLGIWGHVFRIRDPIRANTILSVHTCFKTPPAKILESTRQKFKSAVTRGYGPEVEKKLVDRVVLFDEPPPRVTFSQERTHVVRPQALPVLRFTFPGIDIITGSSIPNRVNLKGPIRSSNDRMVAYFDTFLTLPGETVKFLSEVGKLYEEMDGSNPFKDFIPESVYTKFINTKSTSFAGCSRYVGEISCVQEPSLKARWIANPNRFTQFCLQPLGILMYDQLSRIASDCTYNQEQGVLWAQEKLGRGQTLESFDLSSATDRLNLTVSMELYISAIYRKSLKQLIEAPSSIQEAIFGNHLHHFLSVARGTWNGSRTGVGDLEWEAGQPLGTYPSFALLGLTHNIVGRMAARETGLDMKESFRVIGDDVIMDSRMSGKYQDLMVSLGAEFNDSKHLKSSLLGEFAGRIFDSKRVIRKNVHFLDPSDQSFMEIASYLGDQAKGLLRPQQRKMYEAFKYVPGIVVPGGFPKHSFGQPFETRYLWYLFHSGLTSDELAPEHLRISPQAFALKLKMFCDQRSMITCERGRELTVSARYDRLPFSNQRSKAWGLTDPILPDPELWRPTSRDPRLVNGEFLLGRLKSAASSACYIPYLEYRLSQAPSIPSEVGSPTLEGPPAAEPKVTKRVKSREWER